MLVAEFRNPAGDIRVASVHSHFDQPRREMTRRFVVACENPHVNITGAAALTSSGPVKVISRCLGLCQPAL
jgi:histidinol phosphatase-like PHP family hydrolase